MDDMFKYSYDGALLDTDCSTVLGDGGGGGGGGGGGAAAAVPAVWLVVVQQEGDYRKWPGVCTSRLGAAHRSPA